MDDDSAAGWCPGYVVEEKHDQHRGVKNLLFN